MIDRLEELLAQVESGEMEEPELLLKQVRLSAEYPAAESRRERAESAGTLPGAEERPEPALPEMLTHRGTASGLPELYRQMAQVTGMTAAAGHGSVAVIRETIPADTAGLTAGQLDLAMRRDSRRYDGGMTIY